MSVEAVPVQDFGRSVPQSDDTFAEFGIVSDWDPGQPKVGDLDDALRVHEQVSG